MSNANAKRYLVTGGAGFIGSTLVRRLLKDGHAVVVLDDLSTGDVSNVDAAARLIRGSVLDEDALVGVGRVDGIFHLAAMSKVLPSLGDPNMANFCTEQNVLGTINVLKFAMSHDPPVKVVYSASSTCYGNGGVPQSETAAVACQTPYALSKYVGELYCALFHDLYRVPSVRLRYFMVFGPGEPSLGSYAVVSGIFLKRRAEGKELVIHGDGSQSRDFVHVEDVCEANVRAMGADALVNATINVGTGEAVTIQALADWIDPVHQRRTLAREHDLKATLCDTTLLQQTFGGWKPMRRIQDYVRERLDSM